MGCRVCRARKVKCDGRPNGCRNCERLQLECLGDNGAPASHQLSAPASLKKIRTYRSCASCRLSKTKCNGNRPRCSRCAAKKTDCVYDGGAAPRWARNLDWAARSVGLRGTEMEAEMEAETEEAAAALSERSRTQPAELTPDSMTEVMTLERDTEDAISSQALRTLLPEGSHSLSSIEPSDSGMFSWLLSPSLPTGRNLRSVVEQYFANIHPLRCFAFVHKPSFMRQLDKGSISEDESALLYIVCAHGAKFLALKQQQTRISEKNFLSNAGNQWAQKAELIILTNYGKISVQRLMVAILLHDFHFRLGEYPQALMLSGLAVRMAHALKINTEASPDILCTVTNDSAPSVVTRESRRRLMWACYVLDAWAGSGNDQLSLLRENDIKIQLPCNERNFGLRIASVTETLGVGHVLQSLPPAIVPSKPAQNMGIMAYYIRVVALWKRIVRYVNHLDASPPPWQAESAFTTLYADLRLWRKELPNFVEYSTETIYARLDSNQLGALVLIHCTYHHNFLELYKLSMPDLFKLPKPFEVPPEQCDFLKSAQANCYHHAQQIADILAEAADHGAHLLSDSLLPYFVYDSSRVILYYVARLLDPNRHDAQAKMNDAINAVESNRRVLQMMSSLFPIAQSLSNAIDRWLFKIRQSSNKGDLVETRSDIPDGERSRLSAASASPAQGTPEYTFPSISLQSLARTGIATRRAADRAAGSRILTWPTDNPDSSTAWDHSSIPTPPSAAAAALAQDAFIGANGSLQHERPLPTKQPLLLDLSTGQAAAIQPMCEALDLDDLQVFLTWDMCGTMEMGDPLQDEVLDGMDVPSSWIGAV